MTVNNTHSIILHLLVIIVTVLGISNKKSVDPLIRYEKSTVTEIKIVGVALPDDALTYRLEPFHVPDGVGAIEVSFQYAGKNDFSEMEIGLYDPERFRGTSRFSKDSFYLSSIRATASYIPGPIISGEWNISLGFPTINKKAEYEVTIRLIPKDHIEFTGPSETTLKENEQWYRGDFHSHTGHSDAFGCEDLDGNRGPCQVYQIVESAKKNGLDFVAITDHNTVSHHQDMTVIQPLFKDLLLIRGQEVTTFYGHSNVYGTSIPLDFRVGFEGQTFEKIQQVAEEAGALLSINHPGRETGANCTGCGWSAENTDYDKLEVVEIVNGTNVENEIAGIPFWHHLLNKGYKITGIGGSDVHSAGFGDSQPGTPTTMVYAKELSEKAILDAVRKGNVYLKTMSSNGPDISFQISSEDKSWSMGETIDLNSMKSNSLEIVIEYSHSEKQQLELIFNGELFDPEIKQYKESEHTYRLIGVISNPGRGWLRFNLRDKTGRITVVSNPVYLE
ncbi:CehA/McbA family metallohydrolase [Rhodohalobacter sulfatireducens]|uniref:CehA/McbA family metallohydrolase n=1 Tax=Rhodohalobacter sulfatireducens TaxID=2911366 RepID=A0ABS9KJB4_9BACT|nr:CehA/McbA family metallohydrolase [Rhodohalobacter sulfatireducens]MCG2590943.1 CehA/McbA family metallohydrolase [Rhodohalobacter sulfatireducens]